MMWAVLFCPMMRCFEESRGLQRGARFEWRARKSQKCGGQGQNPTQNGIADTFAEQVLFKPLTRDAEIVQNQNEPRDKSRLQPVRAPRHVENRTR
jgi:hypothetical protein